MRISKRSMILLVLAGGFFMLIFEVRDLHREVLSEHWQAQIPIWFGFLAFIATFAAMMDQRILRSVSAAIFGLGCVVGLIGLYQHSEGDPSRVLQPFIGQITAYADEDRGEREEEKGKESHPPPLAPLGIAGLSAIGLILSIPNKRGASQDIL